MGDVEGLLQNELRVSFGIEDEATLSLIASVWKDSLEEVEWNGDAVDKDMLSDLISPFSADTLPGVEDRTRAAIQSAHEKLPFVLQEVSAGAGGRDVEALPPPPSLTRQLSESGRTDLVRALSLGSESVRNGGANESEDLGAALLADLPSIPPAPLDQKPLYAPIVNRGKVIIVQVSEKHSPKPREGAAAFSMHGAFFLHGGETTIQPGFRELHLSIAEIEDKHLRHGRREYLGSVAGPAMARLGVRRAGDMVDALALSQGKLRCIPLHQLRQQCGLGRDRPEEEMKLEEFVYREVSGHLPRSETVVDSQLFRLDTANHTWSTVEFSPGSTKRLASGWSALEALPQLSGHSAVAIGRGMVVLLAPRGSPRAKKKIVLLELTRSKEGHRWVERVSAYRSGRVGLTFSLGSSATRLPGRLGFFVSGGQDNYSDTRLRVQRGMLRKTDPLKHDIACETLAPRGMAPVGRLNHSSVCVGKKLIIFGGIHYGTVLNDVWVLLLSSNTWCQVQLAPSCPQPPPRCLHAAAPVGGNAMVVFGGRSEVECSLGDVWMLHLGAVYARGGQGEEEGDHFGILGTWSQSKAFYRAGASKSVLVGSSHGGKSMGLWNGLREAGAAAMVGGSLYYYGGRADRFRRCISYDSTLALQIRKSTVAVKRSTYLSELGALWNDPSVFAPDVSILTKEGTFVHAHSAILVATCPYFRRKLVTRLQQRFMHESRVPCLFCSDQTTVDGGQMCELDESWVDAADLQLVLQFLHSRSVTVPAARVASVLHVCNVLEIGPAPKNAPLVHARDAQLSLPFAADAELANVCIQTLATPEAVRDVHVGWQEDGALVSESGKTMRAFLRRIFTIPSELARVVLELQSVGEDEDLLPSEERFRLGGMLRQLTDTSVANSKASRRGKSRKKIRVGPQEPVPPPLAWRLGCDVLVRVGDSLVPCHRAILAARSSFFRGMFQSGMEEAVMDEVPIGDDEVDQDVGLKLLEYLYTDQIRQLDPDDAIALFSLASLHLVPRLVCQCEEAILHGFDTEDPESLLGIIAFAFAHGSAGDSLKNHCLDLLAMLVSPREVAQTLASMPEIPEEVAAEVHAAM